MTTDICTRTDAKSLCSQHSLALTVSLQIAARPHPFRTLLRFSMIWMSDTVRKMFPFSYDTVRSSPPALCQYQAAQGLLLDLLRSLRLYISL